MSSAYHYAQANLSKVEPRALKCMFIGYLKGVKGYKLWDFNSNRSLISRDGTFKEDEPYMDSEIVNQLTLKSQSEPSTSSDVEIHSRHEK